MILGRDFNSNFIFVVVVCSYDVQCILIFVSTMCNPFLMHPRISQKCPSDDIYVLSMTLLSSKVV